MTSKSQWKVCEFRFMPIILIRPTYLRSKYNEKQGSEIFVGPHPNQIWGRTFYDCFEHNNKWEHSSQTSSCNEESLKYEWFCLAGRKQHVGMFIMFIFLKKSFKTESKACNERKHICILYIIYMYYARFAAIN